MISDKLLESLFDMPNAVRYSPRYAKHRDQRKPQRSRRLRRNEIAFQSRKRNRK